MTIVKNPNRIQYTTQSTVSNRGINPDASQPRKILIQLYPNNEIRLRATRGIPNKNRDTHEDRINKFKARCFDKGVVYKEKHKPKEDQERPGWGLLPNPTKFTMGARRTIQRVGGVVDRRFGSHKSTFLTGTLPGSTVEAMRGISLYSGYMINRVNQWLRRKVEKLAAFYVWERQARGALHLHYCFVCEDEEVLSKVEREFQGFWYDLLCDVSDKSGIDLFAREKGGTWRDSPGMIQTRAERVKKSVSAYLSKYATKGNQHKHNPRFPWGNAFYPSRWWGCSQSLLDSLREMTETTSVMMSESQWQSAQSDFILAAKELAVKPPYQYWDKFGCGHNTVAYHKSNDTHLWSLVKETFTAPQCHIDPDRRKWDKLVKLWDERERDDAALEAWEDYGQTWIGKQLSANNFLNELRESTPKPIEYDGSNWWVGWNDGEYIGLVAIEAARKCHQSKFDKWGCDYIVHVSQLPNPPT